MNKSGITISVLVITIVVLSVIIGTAIFMGVGSANNANVDRYLSTLNSVEELCGIYKLTKGEYPVVKDNNKVVEVAPTSLAESIKGQLNLYNDFFTNLQVIDTSKINVSDLTIGRAYEADNKKYLLSQDIFLLNVDSGRVYYMKGISYNGVMLHTADQITSVTGRK